MRSAIRNVVGEATVHKGKVKLDMPPLVENGNVVSITVSVDSPMTAGDHVKAIHVFNENNPQPNVIGDPARPARRPGQPHDPHPARRHARRSSPLPKSATARSGRDSVEVIVTLAACVEAL